MPIDKKAELKARIELARDAFITEIREQVLAADFGDIDPLLIEYLIEQLDPVLDKVIDSIVKKSTAWLRSRARKIKLWFRNEAKPWFRGLF